MRVKTGERENDTKLIAQLIRSKATRTVGTNARTAGNGGELTLSKDAEEFLAERLIVATCITMLKREIDRRRFKQFTFLVGVLFA